MQDEKGKRKNETRKPGRSPGGLCMELAINIGDVF